MTTCQHCGREYTPHATKGSAKYLFCDDPECQTVCADLRKLRQKEASRKWREKIDSGVKTKPYKAKESKLTGRTCKQCHGPIKKYKENGAWITPYWLCKKCSQDRANYENNLKITSKGDSLERIDGDYLFMC